MKPTRCLCLAPGIFSLTFSDKLDTEHQVAIERLRRQLAAEGTDAVAGFGNLTVFTGDQSTDTDRMIQRLDTLPAVEETSNTFYRYHLPVIYGGEMGPDLGDVAEHCGMTTEAVIRLHAETTYSVYLIGFQPGFPYLGGLDKRLHTPRRQPPRTLVPAGAVGIGGEQTGVYPFASPGGWQLIGRTDALLFNDVPLLSTGDEIRFVPVDRFGTSVKREVIR